MKKSILSLFAISTLILFSCEKKQENVAETSTTETTQTEATTTPTGTPFNVQVADSKLEWEGAKVSGDKHNGTITFKEGQIFINEGKISGGKFVVDMNTITVLDIKDDAEMKAMLEGHLKGTKEDQADHFFNVNQHPTATFEITSVAEEAGKQSITGNLTIKGQTNEVKFPADVVISENEVTLNSGDIEIDRTKWGVNFNSGSVVKDLAADKIIKDQIKIKVSVKATK